MILSPVDVRRLAILAKAGNPVTLRDMREIEAAAGSLGLTVVTLEIRRVEDITAGFEALKARANMFPPDPLLSTYLICWGGDLFCYLFVRHLCRHAQSRDNLAQKFESFASKIGLLER
jgi:hypothetical protein